MPAGTGPGGLDAAEVRRAWGTVLEKVQESKRVTHARLLETTVASLEGRRLSVAFTTPTLARQFMTGVHVDTLRDALKDVLGADFEVVCVSGPGREAPSNPGPSGPRGSGPAPARSRPEPVHEGFAPGDEAAPDDPDAPVERGEDAALRLVERALGGRVLGTIGD